MHFEAEEHHETNSNTDGISRAFHEPSDGVSPAAIDGASSVDRGN
jgi:hypothetical protein